jgi:hypothetical protein
LASGAGKPVYGLKLSWSTLANWWITYIYYYAYWLPMYSSLNQSCILIKTEGAATDDPATVHENSIIYVPTPILILLHCYGVLFSSCKQDICIGVHILQPLSWCFMNWLDFPLPKISMFWSLQDIASFLPNNSDSFSKTEGPRRIWIDLHLVQCMLIVFLFYFPLPWK